MTETVTTPDGRAGLRLGRWQDVLADVTECDAVITDPPYGARTHAGHDKAVSDLGGGPNSKPRSKRRALEYAPWSETDVSDFCQRWCSTASGWIVALTSHDLFNAWQAAYRAHGRCDFQPVPALIPGMTVRLAGDGPSSWAIWLAVSRPRTKAFATWGTLPGGYKGPPGSDHIGGKPLWLMRAIIRDYTRPGDLIVDPCAGGATTLLAAAIEGRYAVGAEMDPETFEKAAARMRAGFTPDLFGGAA